MKLNQAVSKRLSELLDERNMTQYQLYMKSGVPKSTIGNIINCSYDSVKLRVIHELCQGLSMDLPSFFASPLFQEENLENGLIGCQLRFGLCGSIWNNIIFLFTGWPTRASTPKHCSASVTTGL